MIHHVRRGRGQTILPIKRRITTATDLLNTGEDGSSRRGFAPLQAVSGTAGSREENRGSHELSSSSSLYTGSSQSTEGRCTVTTAPLGAREGTLHTKINKTDGDDLSDLH